MSRTIKFRGVHPHTKTIMDVCVIDWMHDEVYFEQGSDVAYPIDECNLIQFTGLKDRNGVEIYEGDIIKQHLEWSGGYMSDEYGEMEFSGVASITASTGVALNKCKSRDLIQSGLGIVLPLMSEGTDAK